MDKKQFVIIGSGIAGLYLGYYLTKRGHPITIIEKEKSLGGRMFTETVEMEGQTYHLEGGAGVIRSDEGLIKKFLEHLKIPVSYWRSQTALLYHKNKRTESLNHYDYIEILENICHHASNNQTFLDAIDQAPITQKEKIGVILGTTYYELLRTNARNICDTNDFNEFLFNDLKYEFGKPEAWTQVMDLLGEKILKQGGQIIHEDGVVDILDHSVKTKSGKVLSFDQLVITCPYHAFKKIKVPLELNPWKEFMDKYHHETNYLRIYSYFEEDLDIPMKIASNLSIRRVIPLSKRMIMSVYTDGEDATYIQQLCKEKNHQKLNQYIRKELKLLLAREIPKIKKNWCYYFYKGISNWEPSELSVEEIVEKIRNPIPNLYFCGDTYSTHPGWIQGAVESCQFILRKF
jgi:monoamine oxidase